MKLFILPFFPPVFFFIQSSFVEFFGQKVSPSTLAIICFQSWSIREREGGKNQFDHTPTKKITNPIKHLYFVVILLDIEFGFNKLDAVFCAFSELGNRFTFDGHFFIWIVI